MLDKEKEERIKKEYGDRAKQILDIMNKKKEKKEKAEKEEEENER